MAGEATVRELPVLSGAQRLVDAVQGALREAIMGGTLRAGEQLSVPELARRLNVSRSPVREAVLGLVAQGLAVEQPRRGVVVATIAAEDLFAIHEMREFLEAGAARLAAQRIDKPGIVRLKQILAEQQRAVVACDAEGYFRTNAELHRAIARGAGNQRLDAVLAVLENQMRIALHRVAADARHIEAGWAEHAAVVEAIAAGNADAAEQAMRRHIANTIERSRRALAPPQSAG
jgi:DNA-binding GntR family transcriptional regulator